MPRVRAAAFATIALAAACSAPGDTGPPPATPDEQRALAEAREMIPPEEIASEPGSTAAPGETPTP